MFNQQGWTNSFDLNAISNGTSPAFSLHTEYPSGKEYATYLEGIVKMNKLNVRTLTEVVSIHAVGKKKDLPLFSVDIRFLTRNTEEEDPLNSKHQPVTENLTARYIVWAAGEFQYPRSTTPTNLSTNAETTRDLTEEKQSEIDKDTTTKQTKPLWYGTLPTQLPSTLLGHTPRRGIPPHRRLRKRNRRCDQSIPRRKAVHNPSLNSLLEHQNNRSIQRAGTVYRRSSS